MNTQWSTVQKRREQSTLNLAYTDSRNFSNNELFGFCGNTLANFEIRFWTKTVKSRLFKKCLKRRKTCARFCLGLGNMHFSDKKLQKTTNLLGTFIFLIFRQREKGTKQMFKKVRLSMELHWKYGSSDTFMHIDVFLFCLKGCSEI